MMRFGTWPACLRFIVLAVAVVFGVGVGSLSAAPQQTPKAVKGELIVGFAEGVSRHRAERDPQGRRRDLEEALRPDRRRPREGEGRRGGVRRQGPLERSAGRLRTSRTTSSSIAATPNDPSFSQLWGLHNTGQTGGTNDKDIDAPEAWELATGDSSIVVAVTDTGRRLQPSRPHRPALGEPARSGRRRATTTATVSSTTGAAGTSSTTTTTRSTTTATGRTSRARSAPRGDNGVGVVGVNWNVKIMALKFLNSAGSGTTADAIASTLYAADHGADVSSNSWGGGPYDQALLDAIEYGASRGMLFVAAAGNDGFNNDVTPTYPGDVRLGRRARRRRHRPQRRPGVLLELRRQVRRSRRSRRGHSLDDARQHLRVLRRDLDGHAARRGSGGSRRGQVPGSDAVRDQGAAHELGGSRRARWPGRR